MGHMFVEHRAFFTNTSWNSDGVKTPCSLFATRLLYWHFLSFLCFSRRLVGDRWSWEFTTYQIIRFVQTLLALISGLTPSPVKPLMFSLFVRSKWSSNSTSICTCFIRFVSKSVVLSNYNKSSRFTVLLATRALNLVKKCKPCEICYPWKFLVGSLFVFTSALFTMQMCRAFGTMLCWYTRDKQLTEKNWSYVTERVGNQMVCSLSIWFYSTVMQALLFSCFSEYRNLPSQRPFLRTFLR